MGTDSRELPTYGLDPIYRAVCSVCGEVFSGTILYHVRWTALAHEFIPKKGTHTFSVGDEVEIPDQEGERTKGIILECLFDIEHNPQYRVARYTFDQEYVGDWMYGAGQVEQRKIISGFTPVPTVENAR